jgi:hypothetical protein
MPGLILSPLPLADAKLNIGLGLYNPFSPSYKQPQTRRRSGSFTYASGLNYASGNKLPNKRSALAAGLPQPNRSPRFDPFASDLPPASSTSYSHYWEYDPSTNGPKLRTSPPSRPPKLPSSPPKKQSPHPTPTPRLPCTTPTLAPISLPDKTARSKHLAGILLNRIHAVGKPVRRRCFPDSYSSPSRPYVKSSLSRVVSVEC